MQAFSTLTQLLGKLFHESRTRIALGCSISNPDMSQSNCCQVSALASWLFRGHRYRPWATSSRL